MSELFNLSESGLVELFEKSNKHALEKKFHPDCVGSQVVCMIFKGVGTIESFGENPEFPVKCIFDTSANEDDDFL